MIIKRIYGSVFAAVALWLISLLGNHIGTKCYTFDWILNRRLYLLAAIIATVALLFGKWRCSIAAIVGIFLGVACGELFGAKPAGTEFGFGHYGWAIWLGCFLISVITGILLEIVHNRNR